MKKIIFIASLFLLTTPLQVLADEALTGEQIKELFSDKTCDIEKVGENKNNHLKAYTSSDGTRLLYIPWKDKISKRKWWVDKNTYCGSKPKKNDYCREIKNAGNGSYHGYDDGIHIRTFSNFQDGNKL